MNYDHSIYLQQVGLKLLGFAPGPLDGQDGRRTRAAFNESLPSSETGKASTTALMLVELATGEIGVRELPTNSNRGRRVEEFQSATWLDGTGWAWCAAFICWLCREAGVKNRPQTAGAWDFERWARKSNTPGQLIDPNDEQVRAGDILVYTFSHIGLASANQVGDSVKVIEGNTDSSGGREGGGVYARSRSTRQIRSIIRI
tara:strand:+ start:1654 stop:2256 length:603 start_codon:yes stop_codon:yes gene_type:complete